MTRQLRYGLQLLRSGGFRIAAVDLVAISAVFFELAMIAVVFEGVN